MEMIRRQGIILFLILALAGACGEEPINKALKTVDVNVLAVEGVLTNENKNHVIRLTHPYKELNGKPTPATGAVVRITDGTIIYSLTEFPLGSGMYYTPEMRAVFGLQYIVVIQYKGKQYAAGDSSVPVEPLPQLQYRKVANGYTLNLGASGQSPNYIDHTITWKNTAQCTGASPCEGRIVFYDLKTVDVNEAFKPERAEFTFPVNSIIIRKKYSTSESYRTFLRSMLSETEWRGGFFDVERANTITNISNGGIGFFAVSTIITDTTVVVDIP